MKARTLFVAVLCFLGLGATAAAAPTIQPLQFDSVILGGAAVLQAYASDPGGTLTSATFSVSGPAVRDPANLGAITWPAFQQVGVVALSGTPDDAQVIWSPTQAGSYSVKVVVVGSSGTTTQYGYFETVVDRFTIPTGTSIGSGGNQMFLDSGEIRTQESGTVTVQSGGNLIFWAGGRVVLRPGFHAFNGSSFWAAVDHNSNGYSDVEEATCTSGDGIPDAWKVDHSLSIGTSYPQYLAAYLGGYNPGDTSATLPLPTNPVCQLVLRTPSSEYYGVNTSTWTITGL
jgi:hypothetical protein